MTSAQSPLPTIERYASLESYRASRETRRDELDMRHVLMQTTAQLAQYSPYEYYCTTHDGTASFQIDQGASVDVNWRESLICKTCQLNARMRFCMTLIRAWMQDNPAGEIYLTEQATYGYAWLKQRFARVIGSEFIHDEKRKAAIQHYIRHITNDPQALLRIEDVTQLSFADNSLSLVGSFDVLEHVPEYRHALQEIARVLKPGGKLLATFPFLELDQDTVTRAVVNADRTITHRLPPEYHGDPVSDGVLCFHNFGWDILNTLRSVGFASAEVVNGFAPSFGLFGGMLTIVAIK
jgi:SAM-dependent methyltransferase